MGAPGWVTMMGMGVPGWEIKMGMGVPGWVTKVGMQSTRPGHNDVHVSIRLCNKGEHGSTRLGHNNRHAKYPARSQR